MQLFKFQILFKFINLFCIFISIQSSEPSIRGILTACAGIAATLGFFIIFLMGSLMAWRDVAMICLAIPLITMVAVCFVSKFTLTIAKP